MPIGLGLFTVVGIEKSLLAGFPMWVAIIMGMTTGAVGGVTGYIYQRVSPNLPQGYLRHRLYSRRINLLRL